MWEIIIIIIVNIQIYIIVMAELLLVNKVMFRLSSTIELTWDHLCTMMLNCNTKEMAVFIWLAYMCCQLMIDFKHREKLYKLQCEKAQKKQQQTKNNNKT